MSCSFVHFTIGYFRLLYKHLFLLWFLSASFLVFWNCVGLFRPALPHFSLLQSICEMWLAANDCQCYWVQGSSIVFTECCVRLIITRYDHKSNSLAFNKKWFVLFFSRFIYYKTEFPMTEPFYNPRDFILTVLVLKAEIPLSSCPFLSPQPHWFWEINIYDFFFSSSWI